MQTIWSFGCNGGMLGGRGWRARVKSHLTKAWLNLPMTLPTGDGGTCYGDSGGPHFIHLDGVETNIVVSITITGDVPCVTLDKTYRTDTAAAREFPSDFVMLP